MVNLNGAFAFDIAASLEYNSGLSGTDGDDESVDFTDESRKDSNSNRSNGDPGQSYNGSTNVVIDDA